MTREECSHPWCLFEASVFSKKEGKLPVNDYEMNIEIGHILVKVSNCN
jgi:hypothetical protein